MYLTPFGRTGRDPFQDLRRVQSEINRMFGEMGSGFDSPAFPPVNIWANEDGLVVTATVPGVSSDDLDINVRAQSLTIQGKREPRPSDDDKASWHRRERWAGTFGRVIELPHPVDPDKVNATLANGILEVQLHRPEAEKPKKIKIKSA